MLRHWYDIDRDLTLMDEMRRRMERYFDQLDLGAPMTTGTWPRANLYDAGDELVAVLEVPGIDHDDLNIEAHRDALTVSGARKVSPPKGATVHRSERLPGQFSRSFGLPTAVDVERTTANLSNGVLTVKMPKHPEAQPKKISVAAE